MFFLLLDEVFLELRFWSFSPDRTPWSCNLGSALTFVLGSALCWYIGNTMYLTIDLQRGVNGDTDKRGDAARTRKAEIAKKPLLPWPVF